MISSGAEGWDQPAVPLGAVHHQHLPMPPDILFPRLRNEELGCDRMPLGRGERHLDELHQPRRRKESRQTYWNTVSAKIPLQRLCGCSDDADPWVTITEQEGQLQEQALESS